MYEINSDNIDEALSNISGLRSDTITDFRNAVNYGKSIFVHDQLVTIGNWSGLGYIINDQYSGATSYMIEGLSNGSTTGCDSEDNALCESIALGTLAIVDFGFASVTASEGAALALAFLTAISALLATLGVILTWTDGDLTLSEKIGLTLVAIGLVALTALGAAPIMILLLALMAIMVGLTMHWNNKYTKACIYREKHTLYSMHYYNNLLGQNYSQKIMITQIIRM